MELESRLAAARGRRRVLFLDYDGTLVPFAPSPELAVPDEGLLDLLACLAARADTEVHVIGGGPRRSLDTWLGGLPLFLHAEHGLWSRPKGGAWITRLPAEHGRWLRPVEELMRAAVRRAPGSFIERKSASIAWHYRLSDPEISSRALGALRHALAATCRNRGLRLVEGSLALEVRAGMADRGRIVIDALARADGHRPFVLAASDDDDDMFAALPRDAVTVCSGRRRSTASYRVPGPRDVRTLLAALCNSDVETEWVLVVEDNAHIRAAVLELLAGAGISACAVADGAQALLRLVDRSRPPALVLTDLTMPYVDGRELISRIRADRALSRTPLVLMTAALSVADLPDGVPVLQKPFCGEDLVRTVREHLRGEASNDHRRHELGDNVSL